MSLKVEKKVIDEVGNGWYKIEFDEWLRYPQRIYTDWYIQEKYAREFYDVGMRELTPAQLKKAPAPTKHIIVDKSEQKLYAYDGDILFMETIVSTGTVLNPTPVGEFILFRKTPTRYMQGPLPGIPDDIYDLPGVPWVLYFTKEGAAIHGTYWHNNFGNRTSHGCVNVPITQAGILYAWANLNTSITIQE
jgi:lipoprotein-anchoring transpeptidase ErfK/SrfK